MELNALNHTDVRSLRSQPLSGSDQVKRAEEVQEKFNQFVGEMFFGQLMKAMRSTQGKPAYFHGGRAEEVFQGQLDQMMAEEMTEASADQIADPMFRQQFPREAAILDGARQTSQATVADLIQLRRR